MSRGITLIVLVSALVLLCASTWADVSVKEWKNRRGMPANLVRKGTAGRFESQGMYHSAYLILDGTGRFMYYTVYEVGYDIAVGLYARSGDTLTLIGDSARTFEAVKDTGFYKALFAYSIPDPCRVDSVRYIEQIDKLFLHTEPSR
ncbi:MAG: hypothetical protein H6591_03155 [Flavobacteriales bacterium]|nr:hypothetical protein [Flavobacteriales bacterium]